MKFTVKRTTLLVVSLLIASCGEDSPEAAESCTTSADCAEGNLCHPYSKTCAPSCAASAAVCSGTATPECRTTDGDPLENLCVCDDNSCTGGETCNRSTGLCGTGGEQPAAEPGTGLPEGERCEIGSLGAPCADDQLCVGERTCATPCDDVTDCIPSDQVCNEDRESDSYNACASPDDAAICAFGCFDTCPARGDHERSTNGPIIYDIEALDPVGPTANCGAPAIVRRWRLRVDAKAGIQTENAFTSVIRRLNAGDEADVFSEGPMSSSHPTVEDEGADQYTVTFTLCDSPGSMEIFSVFVRDALNRDSNAICFRPDTMPL